MSFKVGWYSAKFGKHSDPEIVYYNGSHCLRNGFPSHYPEEFFWISHTPIIPEEPSIEMVVDSWYLFNHEDETMVGQYKDYGLRPYIRVADNKRWYLDTVNILGGPFTTEELSQRK